MFAVIYTMRIRFEKEEIYKKYWSIIANYFVEHCGALGSCLHKAQELSDAPSSLIVNNTHTINNTRGAKEGSLWVAYSRWPDKETRDKVWQTGKWDSTWQSKTLPRDVIAAIEGLKECVTDDHTPHELSLNVAVDLLFPNAS